MANAKDFPQPNPAIDYKLAYTQGDAVEARENMRLSFQRGVIMKMGEHGRRIGAWFHDDAFGVIATGLTTSPKDLI